MKKSQDLSRIKSRNDIPFGALLMGTTGVLIGLVVDSAMVIIFVGILGALIGGLVGWAGGRVGLMDAATCTKQGTGGHSTSVAWTQSSVWTWCGQPAAWPQAASDAPHAPRRGLQVDAAQRTTSKF